MSLSHQDIDLVRQFLWQADPDVVLFGHREGMPCRFINVTFTYL